MSTARVLDLKALSAVVADAGLDHLLDELIERLFAAFRDHHRDHVTTLARAGFQYDKPDFGLVEWMPAMTNGHRVSIKTVAYHPSNPVERRQPSVLATTSLYDTVDGRLLAICESTFLTAFRTGAASAVATDVLAGQSSRVLGVIGCGAQTVAQIHGVSRVRPIDQVLAYDTNPDVAATLVDRLPQSVTAEVRVIGPDEVAAILTDADIVCTATSNEVGSPPVLRSGPTRPGLHVNAVGSDFPGKIEVDIDLLRRAVVCPDFAEQCLVEGEAQQLTLADLGPDLPRLVADRHRLESLRDELTVFDSTGWAFEDLIAAELFTEHAERLGVGTEVDLQPTPTDPYDPYESVRS